MRMRLTDPVLEQVIFDKELPSDYATKNVVEQSATEIIHAAGTASMRDIWFDGMHILHGSVQINKNLIIKAECDTPVIEMHFGISGSSETTLPGQYKQRFSAGQNNITYTPEFEGYFKSDSHKTYQLLEIHVTEKYFNRFANTGSTLLESFQEQINKKRASMLTKENLVTTMSMNTILHEMANCNRQGVMKRLFLEARMLELLMLQLEQAEDNSNYNKKEYIKASDKEKLQHARFMIEQNICTPHTLSQLSKLVGLNDFKLKKGFKEMFGTTVFGYLHELRMQAAKRLLLDTSKPIHEISDYCGYVYVQHFTTAFRNKFGMTPGSIRE